MEIIAVTFIGLVVGTITVLLSPPTGFNGQRRRYSPLLLGPLGAIAVVLIMNAIEAYPYGHIAGFFAALCGAVIAVHGHGLVRQWRLVRAWSLRAGDTGLPYVNHMRSAER